jgi:inosose dehydratase
VVIAGAPISWGVSEVPGWGHQLRPERVLDGCSVPLCLHIVLGGGDPFFEQDAQLAAEPEPGEGPRADVARSLAYLDAVIAS